MWYIVSWFKKRRRENVVGGTIIPLFYPPKLDAKKERYMTPGEMRYFMNMAYDAKVFAAETVNMAVKGLVTIDYAKKLWGGTYTLTKARDAKQEDMPVHKVLALHLFNTSNSVQLTQAYQTTLQKVAEKLEAHCVEQYQHFFVTNIWTLATPLLLLLASFIGMSMVLGVTVWNFWWVIFFLYLVIVVVAFIFLRTYTPQGCVIKHQILGFKMFLAATETDRMEVIGTPPTKTPELYEKYLPYAIALGVEQQWTRQFATVFAKLESQGKQYHPVWYHGGSFDTFSPTAFSSQISNSLQSAVQSSGGGGRGGSSSGGGRGGGGGGSW